MSGVQSRSPGRAGVMAWIMRQVEKAGLIRLSR